VNIRGIRGCYDESKRFGETLTVSYRQKYGLDTRTVRVFNTYGPRMRPDDGRVVPTFITQALSDQDITVYGDGQQTRSFCYVTDMIDGLASVMRAEHLKHNVYNLGRENEITISKLAETIRSQVETVSDIVHEPLPEDDPTRRRPDLSRVRDELNWRPEIRLEAGLEATVQYFESLETDAD
jgi:UDP-glucuronate decarboxylase